MKVWYLQLKVFFSYLRWKFCFLMMKVCDFDIRVLGSNWKFCDMGWKFFAYVGCSMTYPSTPPHPCPQFLSHNPGRGQSNLSDGVVPSTSTIGRKACRPCCAIEATPESTRCAGSLLQLYRSSPAWCFLSWVLTTRWRLADRKSPSLRWAMALWLKPNFC